MIAACFVVTVAEVRMLLPIFARSFLPLSYGAARHL
jgi:hypothetical protein